MKRTVFIAVLFVLAKATLSQTLLHPVIPSDEITDIVYLNETDVIFINAGGGIYKSYDGGATWQSKKQYPNSFLAEIQSIDDKTIFIRTQNYFWPPNLLIYSLDGGETWDDQPVSLYPVYSFLPVSNSVILKAGLSSIARLDNFFDEWKETFVIPTFIDSSSDLVYEQEYGSIKKLLRKQNGEIVALGTNEYAFMHEIIADSVSYLLNSKDSGVTWDTLWIGLKEEVRDIIYVNDTDVWMISDTSLFKSSDGGKSWSMETRPDPYNYFSSIYASGSTIYILSWINKLLKSSDSGSTWSEVNFDAVWFTSLSFNSEDVGSLFGSGFYRTTNGGVSWSNVNPYIGNDLYDMDFVSAREGIAAANRGLYRTNYGGESWSLVLDPSDYAAHNLSSLEMLNDSSGWFITSDTIYKSENGGRSWSPVIFKDKNVLFEIMDFYDENLGILCASAESDPGSHMYDRFNIYFTEDGGGTWNRTSADTGYFYRMKFTDPGHLWGTTRSGLWLSKDTAKTWEKVFGRDDIYGDGPFDFYDSLFGIYSTVFWGLQCTTDGGKTWKILDKEISTHGVDIKIIGPDYAGKYRVLESGSNGVVGLYYITHEGVLDFSYQYPSYTAVSLNCVETFVENSFPHVWIGGNGFTVIYREFELLGTGVNNPDNVPKVFSLSQNYPNPFNPVTKIQYGVPRTEFISIKIYDMLGKEISVLVDEEKSAGIYNIEFNAGSLSSGIYFYRLQAGDFSETKKMIVLK